jgi:hypothetical protein
MVSGLRPSRRVQQSGTKQKELPVYTGSPQILCLADSLPQLSGVLGSQSYP